MENEFFIFDEPHTASIAAAPFYIPTHSTEGSTAAFEQEQNRPEKDMTCSRVRQCLQNQGSIHSFLAL